MEGGRKKLIRRASSLQSLSRRQAQTAPDRPDVDLNQLVRVYLLDGSSKVLQAKESSTTKDILTLLQFNLDLASIKCHAIFRICHQKVKRLELNEKIKDVMMMREGEEGDVKLLMRAWIHDEEGLFDREAMQDGCYPKVANSALYLKYMEAVCMVMMGKCYLTEDEAVMLGCLKMQADSGDYNSQVHTIDRVKSRVSSTFPSPAKEKMKEAMDAYTPPGTPGPADQMAVRIQLLYSRLTGYSKPEAQIEFLRTLRIWCPFYSAAFFTVECQYDSSPNDAQSQPPVIKMSVGVSKQAIYLITLTTPPVILRQPYNRIVKWVAHKDMNIFCYWILKPDMSPQKVEEMERIKHGGESSNNNVLGDEDLVIPNPVDPGEYCDCVYLVSEYTEDIELVFSSYLDLNRIRARPLLPGDVPDDEDEGEHQPPPSLKDRVKPPPPPTPPPPSSDTESPTGSKLKSSGKAAEKKGASTKRASLFSKMFMATTTKDDDASEEQEDDEEEYNMGGILDEDFGDMTDFYDPHGDVSNQKVAFQDELFPPLSASNIDILNGGTGEAQVAATMEELNNLTFKDFLEDDEEDDDDDEEDSDNSSKSAEKKDLDKPIQPSRRTSLFKW